MKTLNKLFLILFFSVSLLSCHGQHVKSTYHRDLKKWTRQGESFQANLFFVSVKWGATLLSREMILAQGEEVGHIYESPKEKQKFLEEELAKLNHSTRFFVSFYGYDRKNSDLAKAISDWKLALNVNGKKYLPTTIERINKISPLEKKFYPYIDIWSNYYLVTFPVAHDELSKHITLSVHGPFGSNDLTW